MSIVDKAFESQLNNIQKRTGKTLDELYDIIRKSGLAKHGEIVNMLKRELGMGHGDANTVAKFFFKSVGEGKEATTDDAINEIYAGAKAALRPIHEELMAAIVQMGPCEIAPKKGYVSLRRKKQFAMIGPATTTRVEVGLNMKGVQGTGRLSEMPPGSMCQYKVNVTDVKEVDGELIGWIRQAYESAG
jgi:hypothetical protein